MSAAIREHIYEVIQDHWGLRLSEIVHLTGLPRRLVTQTVSGMVSDYLLKMERGVYVAC